MKVLIAGSEGFIGKNARLWLQRSGHEVASIDRNGWPDYRGNVETYLSGALDDFKPDVVLHLAAIVTRARCEENPQSAIRGNAGLTAFVARECARKNIKLAYASTSEVYGDHGHRVVDEDTAPAPTSGVYGMTKLWGEQLVQHYCEDSLIMRLCMAYGPDQEVGPGKAALPTFIYNAIKGESIKVHRGASRSWCFVDDVAKAIRTLVERGKTGVWNVGRDDEHASMLEVALKACRLADADAEKLIEMVDPPRLQTVAKRISCFKLARETGWRPHTGIEAGMKLCYEALVAEHRRKAA